MRESAAFRLQARSDLAAALQLGGETCPPELRAHVIAKAQQSVEKVVKAAVVILSNAGSLVAGVTGKPTTNARSPKDHVVAPYAEAIALFRTSSGGSKPPHALQALGKVFTLKRRNVIAQLDALAPAWPLPGALHMINTEYPYESLAREWAYPGDIGAFTSQETRWLFKEASEIVAEVDRVVNSLELVHPPPP